jgi:NAD(P)-dependent dehydrogenase (short-subunit alcohol dehydrogenase family)
MPGLHGKVAIVTGGGRGIGAATAALLVERGAKVVIAGRTASALAHTVKSVTNPSMHGKIEACAADISQEKEVKRLFAFARDTFGHVSILVNNAAVIEVAPFLDLPISAWDTQWAINVRGAMLCARSLFEEAKQTKAGGTIVNISSLAGIPGTDKFPGFSAYTTTKFAIAGMTEALAVEGKPLGVRVNCIAPGAVDTPMLHKAAPTLHTSTVPDDIAKMVVFLCDNEQSAVMNGSTIPMYTNGN